ncbi:MAG: tRNA-dihydrouridine synthase [Patescibacteria group bacterium]
MSNFWEKLPKPFFALAPMADVTDTAFRRIICKYGKPDVTWTEFVSVDGLCSIGKEKLLIDLKYTEGERPIVAQIFGSKPENFEKVAHMLVEMGFDGIDINMGCPVKKVLNQNSCSALIRTPELAQEIILATMRGAGNLPVSVKTRIGFNKMEIETWIPQVLETKPAALTVHLRTVKEMSLVPAHWEVMKQVVELRNKISPKTLIIGNGDVRDIVHAKELVRQTGCDGIMLGRAIFGNPWLFTGYVPNTEEKLKIMVEHTKLFEELLGKVKNFAIMKKHYKAYVNGFDGAKELRVKLMECNNSREVEALVDNFLANPEEVL